MTNRKHKVRGPWLRLAVGLVLALLVLFFYRLSGGLEGKPQTVSLEEIPPFSGDPFVALYDNQPQFSPEDMTTSSYEYYAPLDALGRCSYTMACIGRDLMPTEDREGISQVKPTGWVQKQYDFVDGKSLYNRCHLIGFQLTGENANERNLITGTRYCNVEGMLPFENMVADYIQETGNHVLYRVTPVFQGQELVARGVQMEAYSVEDQGAGICFHVYVYNNQPGVTIDYSSGESWQSQQEQPTASERKIVYILNVSSKKFHAESCKQGASIKESNKDYFEGEREDLIKMGYTASKCCNP